ncbi:MAG: NAD(P)-dependent oxidoreductase [Deltaproteobacteria bacterium]|nr:NAD(P)-dependent oxidoreductase [Deltaproteobacteria bacterium]
MAIFMTGATGYIGSYATEWLLRNTDHELALLVRAPDYDAGLRCWRRAPVEVTPTAHAGRRVSSSPG